MNSDQADLAVNLVMSERPAFSRFQNDRRHRSNFDVPISSVLPSDSPRLNGEDERRINLLMEANVKLPPIVIHCDAMRVIYGMHRLRAAQRRGAEGIEAEYFDGDNHEAVLFSVTENVAHGLPLSLSDREVTAGPQSLVVIAHRGGRNQGNEWYHYDRAC